MIVIGLGNEFRSDDAVGLIAARKLNEHGVPAEKHQGDPATLIDRWKQAGTLIIIDAIASGVAPGTLHRLDVSTSSLNRELYRNSKQALCVADAIELSRTLGTLPARVFVFGIEAKNLTAGVGLSPEAEGTLPMLIEEVLTCTKLPTECRL
jgi:hydrogenase maturation protease